MANVHVCDVCKADSKLVESTKYMSVKHRPELRLDYCDACGVKTKGLSMLEYVKLVYKVRYKSELSDQEATDIKNRNR